MELTAWMVMEHCRFFVSLFFILLGLAFFFGTIGASKPGWVCVLAAFGIIIVPTVVDIITIIFSHFWAAVFFIVFVISFFTRSGAKFWDNALIFGAAYRASESVWDKFNDKK